MNFNQPFFEFALLNQRRRNGVRRSDARLHHERRLAEGLWRWR
jgi:hypothetical protein